MTKELKDYPNQEFLIEFERRIFLDEEIKFKIQKKGQKLWLNFAFPSKETTEKVKETEEIIFVLEKPHHWHKEYEPNN